MKILLIYPYCLEDRLQAEDVRVVPIGLYYVGALLKENGYDVEILNWHDIDKTPEKIRESLIVKNPDVIGLSILHANRWGGIEIARVAKEINREVKVVFGGIGATFLWKHFLTHFREVDFVVTGEGEKPFLELVVCINKKDYKKIEAVRGIAFRKDGEIVRTEAAEVIKDLDELPNPAKYFEYQHVSSSRGCPGNCTFCGSPQFWGHSIRFHSPEYFVNQLELLNKKGVTFFYFSDDTFTIKKDRVIAICRKILEKGLKITWVAISRVNYVNEEILYWMRKAGCTQISYGVESGSEKLRNRVLGKGIKADQIRKAFALTTRYGILARAYFIYGSPGESRDTIDETVRLIRQIKPLSIIFYILDIFPGTEFYEDFKKRTGAGDDIWLKRIEDIMYFETDPRLSPELILAFGEKLRTGYYKDLPQFADSIELIDNEEFYEMHSDFLSRLAMTFTHGDYSRVEAIKGKEKTAEKLYEKSLGYHPDHRAYLGLAIMKQKRGDFHESMKVLKEGIRYFPESEALHLCRGINLMNLREFEEAISCFMKFPDSEEAAPYISKCYGTLGYPKKTSISLKDI